MNIAILIIAYNNYTHVKDMVEQVSKYTHNITIIDNASTFERLLKYYEEEYKYKLIRMPMNYGHNVWLRPEIINSCSDFFVVTDPDLKLNPNLPSDFLQRMVEISREFNSERVGFALAIDYPDFYSDTIVNGVCKTYDWELPAWKSPVKSQKYPDMELYRFAIDTTFCLYNKSGSGNHLRIAGDFTCIHKPWSKGWKDELAPGEFESYKSGNTSTHYWS